MLIDRLVVFRLSAHDDGFKDKAGEVLYFFFKSTNPTKTLNQTMCVCLSTA